MTLIRLIESALFLGRGLPKATGDFLAWRFETLALRNVLRPLYAFGIVALALIVSEDSSSNEVDALAEFIEQAEAAVRDPAGVCTHEMFPGSFLSDATEFNGGEKEWRRLAAQLRMKFPHAPRMVALMERIEAK